MKPYAKTRKCYCGGPESCNLCRPNTEDKKRSKRANRRKMKRVSMEGYVETKVNVPKISIDCFSGI